MARPTRTAALAEAEAFVHPGDAAAKLLYVTLVSGTDPDGTPSTFLRERGALGYASGVAPATVDVPAGARARHVTVYAGGTAATITIGGGSAITVPINGSFIRTFSGDAALGADVVIGGGVSSYYVEWET